MKGWSYFKLVITFIPTNKKKNKKILYLYRKNMIYIGIPLILLACVAKAISDKLQFHFWTSVFAKWNGYFWNPALSWKRKWKNGDKKQGERFWRSSRQFVIFTDAMHLFNAIYGVLLFTGAAIMGFEIWWLTIGTYIAGKGLFELFFRIILRNE